VRAAALAPLGKRDQPLGEWPQLLRLHQRRADALALEQRRGEVAQKGDPVRRDATELSVCDAVSHGSLYGV